MNLNLGENKIMRKLKSLILNIQKLKHDYILKKHKKENQNVIYVSIDSLNYWWGIYELTEKTDWEDINIYVKQNNKFKKVGRICICSKLYFQQALEALKKDIDQKDFVEKICCFLKNNSIMYHYYYDNINDYDFYEVPFEAKRNETNVKPRSIEIWHPSKNIDKSVLDDCIKTFLKKFMHINVDTVEYKDETSYESAIKEYITHLESMEQCDGISFSEDLIKDLEKEWKVPKEKILEILNIEKLHP